MTPDTGDATERDFVIQLARTARFSFEENVGLSMCSIARIFLPPEGGGFPRKTAKPFIALVGETHADVLNQVRLWLENGAPGMDEAKEKAS